MAKASQAAAEYVGVVGQTAVSTAQRLVGDASLWISDHPVPTAVAVLVLISLFWLTRGRAP